MKRLSWISTALVALLTSSAWAGGGDEATDYYASFCAKVAPASTGRGLVYVDGAEGGFAAESQIVNKHQLTDSFSFTAKAQARDGYKFVKWSQSETGADVLSGDATARFGMTGSTEENPPATVYYANFAKRDDLDFTVQFVGAANGNVYAVDGGTYEIRPDQDCSGRMSTTLELDLKATPAENSTFVEWYFIDAAGKRKSLGTDSEMSCTVYETGTFGAEFTVACDIGCPGAGASGTFKTYGKADLMTALREATSENGGQSVFVFTEGTIDEDFTLPFGATFRIMPGAKVTIADGVTLTAQGKVVNEGAIVGGAIVHSCETIVQGPTVNVPWPDGTDGKSGDETGWTTVDGTAGKYLNTTVFEEDSLSGAGTCDSDTSLIFVTISNEASGRKFASKPATSKPFGLLCTVSRDKALNWISGIVETDNAFSDRSALLLETGYEATGEDNAKIKKFSDTDKMVVLVQSCPDAVVMPATGSTSAILRFAVDLAGFGLSMQPAKGSKGSYQYNGYSLVRCFNGSFTVSHKVMNVSFSMHNCSGSLSTLNGKYNSAVWLYDSPDLSVSFDEVTASTADYGINVCGGGPYDRMKVKFMSGHGKFSAVYAGTFAPDNCPSNYLYDANQVYAEQDPTQGNVWVVKKVVADPSASQTLVNGKASSLTQAFAGMTAGSPVEIVLQKDVTNDVDLTIASGVAVRLDLNGYDLVGSGAIVNGGDLEIIDGHGGSVVSAIGLPIVNNGTLLLSKSIYNGPIALNAGLCQFLAGEFNGAISIAASVLEPTNVAEVCGGRYAETNCTYGAERLPLVNLCRRGYEIGGSIAAIPASYVTGPGEKERTSFSIDAFNPEDDALYVRSCQSKKTPEADRAQYTREEWVRLMKIRASSELFKQWSIDCAAGFDRPIDVAEIAVYVLGIKYGDSSFGFSAGAPKSLLMPIMRDSGMATAPWMYSSILYQGENVGKLSFGLLPNTNMLIGTTGTLQMRLCKGVRNMSGPKDWSYSTYLLTAEDRFVFGAMANKAMLQPAVGEAKFFATLQDAVAAAETDGKTIKLANDCTNATEIVTVGKACTVDLNGFEFAGTLEPRAGFCLEVRGSCYVFDAVRPVEIVTDVSGASDETVTLDVPDAVVSEAEAAVREELGETATADEVAAKVTEKIQADMNATDSNGLKVWENKLVEQAAGRGDDSCVGFAAVDAAIVHDKDGKTVVASSITENLSLDISAQAVSKTDLPTGTYRQTKVVADAAGKSKAVPDADSEIVTVINNVSAEKVVVMPIPAQTKLSEAVATEPSEGDAVFVYGTDKNGAKGYLKWEYDGTAWQPKNTEGAAGSPTLVNDAPASEMVLPAGSVIKYEKKDPARNVVVQTVFDENVVSEPTDVPSAEDPSAKWNLMANPSPKDFDVEKVKADVDAGDRIVILAADGLGQRELKRKDGKWGYWKNVVNPSTGRIKKEWVDGGKVKGGQSMWYISNGGRPKIEWAK